MREGLVHIYTGEGKGKTTCSMGLALRAAGQEQKVCIVQFLKGGGRGSGEMKIISDRIPEIEFIQSELSHPMFSKKKMQAGELEAEALKTFELCREKGMSGDFDLLIMDEINNVIDQSWLDWQVVADFIDDKPKGLEVVMTGRNAHPMLQSLADYVTEMLKIKHPYDDGYVARRGVEY